MQKMKLLSESQRKHLDQNGRHKALMRWELAPVVRLFNRTGPGNWLLSETDPSDADIAWGLCDSGKGPEFGTVRLSELERLGVECDEHFSSDKQLYDYLAA